MTTFRPLFPLALVSCVLALAGCASKDTADAEATDGTEAAASVSQSSRLEELVVAPITSNDPAQAAASLAADEDRSAGCATRTKDPQNPLIVRVHLNDCTGPFGLHHHSGDLTVTFRKGEGEMLHADVVSSNMTVDGRPVTYTKTKDILISGTTRTVHSTGEWTRENARGETVTHEMSAVTVVDVTTHCRTTNGTGVTTVGAREIDTTITDYKTCHGADGAEGCPSGTLSHVARLSGKTEEVTFDGSATATITGPRGRTEEVSLVCTP
jgi:outer membrane murein-binding lipoprotein Lpp